MVIRERAAFVGGILVWVRDDYEAGFKLHYISQHISEILYEVKIFQYTDIVTTDCNFEEGLMFSRELLGDTLSICKRLIRRLAR